MTNDYSWSLLFNKLDTGVSLKLSGDVSKPKEKRSLTIKPLKEITGPKPGDPKDRFVGQSSRTVPVDRVNGLAFQYSLKKGNDKDTKVFNAEIRKSGDDFHRVLPEGYRDSLKGLFVNANYDFGENTRRFNDIQIRKQDGKILKILQRIEPGIHNLSVGSDDILYCDVGFPELVPVNMVGEGINRLLSIILAIYEASNGVVLIDEVENGFHYSALEHLWEAIFMSAIEFDVQVFATTHSFENIKAYRSAYDKLERFGEQMKLYRIEKGEDTLDLIDINHDMLQATLENDLEVR